MCTCVTISVIEIVRHVEIMNAYFSFFTGKAAMGKDIHPILT